MFSSGVPSGSSTRPVFFILPTSEKTLVPVLAGVPNLANSSPPIVTMTGTLIHVSTLLMFVGLP
jgi:hypothetical protein